MLARVLAVIAVLALLSASSPAMAPMIRPVCIEDTEICIPDDNKVENDCAAEPTVYERVPGVIIYWQDRDGDGMFLRNDWLYVESNNQTGLQASPGIEPNPDPCGEGATGGDTLLA